MFCEIASTMICSKNVTISVKMKNNCHNQIHKIELKLKQMKLKKEQIYY